MTNSIIPVSRFLALLKEKYPSIKAPAYMFKEWYSEEERIFFDCKDEHLEGCLENALKRDDFSYFVVYLVAKNNKDGSLEVMDISYPNIGKTGLGRWVDRYHSQLKTASLISLEVAGKEYVEYLGSSYEE